MSTPVDQTNSSTQIQDLSEDLEDNGGYIVINIDSETGTPVQQNEDEYSLRFFLAQLNLLLSLPSLRGSRPEAKVTAETRPALIEQEYHDENFSKHARCLDEPRKLSQVSELHSAVFKDPTDAERVTRSHSPHTDPDFRDLDDGGSVCTDTDWILASGVRSAEVGYGDGASSEGSRMGDGDVVSGAANSVVVSEELDFSLGEDGEVENGGGTRMFSEEERVARAGDGVAMAAMLTVVLVVCVWMLEARGASDVM